MDIAQGIGRARFIPACAGSRILATCADIDLPVHPRVRGEQIYWGSKKDAPGGSSPRARGAGFGMGEAAGNYRFIPACAGSSNANKCKKLTTAVHPRVRGEQS